MHSHEDALATLGRQIAAIATLLAEIVTMLTRSPVKIVLALPTITRRGTIMANFELMNDTVATIPIQTADSAGAVEPYPAGDVFTAVSSNPASLGAAIVMAGAVANLVLTPLVQASPGLSVVISDSAGLSKATLMVDIVDDLSDTTIVPNVAGATTTAQPVPTAPGP